MPHFGYEEVSATEKTARVGAVFASVAARYDVMNDVLSAGLHRLWKDQFVTRINPQPGWRMVDMAGGTGDIAFRLQDRVEALAQKRGHAKAAEVLVCDINSAMLGVGRDRAINQQRLQNESCALRWAVVNAEHLPFENKSADAYSIAFGIRNVTDIPQALREAHRVLRPGSMFACLEFSPEVHPALQKGYDAYASALMPRLGQWIAGDAASYRYLAESIRMFPKAEMFSEMLRAAGFARVSYTPLSMGIVNIHTGWRL